jgi:hypothetical protein
MSLGILVAVHIVSEISGAVAPPDDVAKHARAGEAVTLHAVIEARDGEKRIYYSDAKTIRIDGATIETRSLDDLGEIDLRWYKVEPTEENLSNTSSGKFRYERIAYDEVEVTGWRDDPSVTADVRPTLTPDRGGGLGTMRYKVAARVGRATVESPGKDARRTRAAGGLTDDVHRVSIRRDDSYVGWLTELYGQPYIWASAGSTDRTHQSERLEGSDCADFVTYGWRRLGHDVPYTWTEGLRKYTRKLSSGSAREDGVYVDKKGDPIPFPKVGDLVLFPRHVGVLVEDRGVKGVLDTQDRMAHTLFESPHEEPIADSGYADMRVDVMRWKP